MYIRVVSLFCLLLFAPHSYAQERTTYLLIDASGSMAEKDAEGEIKKLLSPITAQNPKARGGSGNLHTGLSGVSA